MKYVIIGNGILGLSTAFRLINKVSKNDQIVVIGPNDRTGCATNAAAAMLNSFGEISAYSLKSEYDLYHFELSHLATQKWPEFERELIDAGGDNLPDECSKCQVLTGGCFDKGTYIINNSASDDWDDRNFNAIVKALEDFNEQYEFVDPLNIPNYKPAQQYRATRALYIPNEGWLNPKIVLKKMDAIVENAENAENINQKVSRLIYSNNKISGVELENGKIIEGDQYLLATGATVSDLLKESKIDLKMQRVFYGIGVSVEIKCPGHSHEKCIRTPNRGGACGIYSAPYFKGPGTDTENDHIIIGASNRIQPNPATTGRVQSVSHLLDSAINEINTYFYGADLININVGWRPTSVDTYPLIGRTTIENLTIASGTKRDGFHLSPVLSEFLASFLLNEKVDERINMFSPEREVIRDISREDAIEMITNSLMSEQFQHGYSPSNPLMNNQLRESYRIEIEKLHDKVGANDWGIHPELVNMYRYGFIK